jgi:hypothetical protein
MDPLDRPRLRWLPPLLLAVALPLAACGAGAPSPPTADAAPGTPAARPAQSCPEMEFDPFLARFGREIAFQETAVADPLVSERYDAEAGEEPRLVVSRVPLREVTWPVMPDPALLARQGRTLEVAATPDGGRSVRILTPDTSDQQTYHFARSPCWTLVRVVDESI